MQVFATVGCSLVAAERQQDVLDVNLAEGMTYINQLTATVRSENQTCADAATDQSEEFLTASSQGD